MRRKMIVLILPIVLFVIIAGSALGTWYFGILSTENQTGAGIEVEGMDPRYYGDVTIPNKQDIKIIVHQKGIHLSDQIKVRYNPNGYNYVPENMDHIYTLYVPAHIDKYVQVHSSRLVKDPTLKHHTDETGKVIDYYLYSGTWEPSDPDHDNIYMFTTDLYFGYQSNMKPLTEAQVLDLLNLRGQTILAKFELKPKNVK